MEINIRTALCPGDSITASRIYARSWRVGYRGLLPDSVLSHIQDDTWVDKLNDNYITHRLELAILSLNGEDAGAASYGYARDIVDKTKGEIVSFYFLQPYWGSGCAGALMDHAIDRLRQIGCRRFRLWVLRENVRARRFYEKYGFSLSGREMLSEVKGTPATLYEYSL